MSTRSVRGKAYLSDKRKHFPGCIARVNIKTITLISAIPQWTIRIDI
jgi:hypothetical protein